MSERSKPDWLVIKAPDPKAVSEMRTLLEDLNLHTICESALCPNIGVCYARGTATFMILGDICTRNCRFCAVKKGTPLPSDPKEPRHVAEAVSRLRLKYVVVTSVTRDDLEDLGSHQFAMTINEVKRLNPNTGVEVLIPDFQGLEACLKTVLEAEPDVVAHNVETVPRLYSEVRPKASYRNSLKVLRKVKELEAGVLTKSGLMVGLGETEDEVVAVMKDLRSVGCDIMTLGQYLRPSEDHLKVKEFVRPEKFERYKETGMSLGFLHVESGPLVRSSFRASEYFSRIALAERQRIYP